MFAKELVLISLALLMGSTFSLVKLVLSALTPSYLVAVRYILAAFLSLFLSFRTIFQTSRYDGLSAIAIAVLIVVGHTCHTIGLQYISSSQSAFIIAFYVPLVPFLQNIVTKKRTQPLTWLAIALSFLGLIILAGIQNVTTLHWNKGIIFTFSSALTLALALTLTGRLAPAMDDTRNVATLQLLTCALLSVALAAFQKPQPFPPLSWSWLLPIFVLALISAYKQFAMNWIQKTITPAHVTLTMSIEPIFASMIGWFRGEFLTTHALIGAGLILTAFFVTAFALGRRNSH